MYFKLIVASESDFWEKKADETDTNADRRDIPTSSGPPKFKEGPRGGPGLACWRPGSGRRRDRGPLIRPPPPPPPPRAIIIPD
ncbi:hypothetical protein GWI33_023301 [Rhynchophorus ferrugineus]|uniref:Uncharacterized protein n=1 Tax=Rhynchophorus ferrugineus TaxID=354439 RepID=A0A834HMU6_RHYFE|nr:hypothetical protein GWI33_023301 [Rhynchophorus ferrugineus]